MVEDHFIYFSELIIKNRVLTFKFQAQLLFVSQHSISFYSARKYSTSVSLNQPQFKEEKHV